MTCSIHFTMVPVTWYEISIIEYVSTVLECLSHISEPGAILFQRDEIL
jgi:hypothetical protein